MHNAPDNTDVALAHYADALREQGLDTFEIALRLTALSNAERVWTMAEVENAADHLDPEVRYRAEMLADLQDPEVQKAYHCTPEQEAQAIAEQEEELWEADYRRL